jgi:hypothetical protein
MGTSDRCALKKKSIKLAMCDALPHVYTKHTYECMHKDSVYTSLRNQCASIRKTNLLMLYGEMVSVYCENHVEYKIRSVGKNQRFLCKTWRYM